MDLLLGVYRRKVLAVLFLRPEEAFHVREIGRLAQVPAGSLHRELRALADAGYLIREPVGNQVRYRANQALPIYDELTEILKKTAGLADLLREALAPLASRIRTAFVFGSIARGAERSSSDVDLCVLGDVELAEVVKATWPLRARFGREINPVVMTPAEFQADRAKGDRFVTRIMSEPKHFVIGGLDEPR